MKTAFPVLVFLFLTIGLLPAGETHDPGPGWQLVWSDDFNGSSLNTNNWNIDMGYGDIPEKNMWGWGVGGLQDYTDSPENVFVSNGNLVLRALYTGGDRDKRSYTSGKVHTRGKRSFQYGIIAARIKMPSGTGSFPAFWMVGTNNHYTNASWPQTGEIDIIEIMEGGVMGNVAAHWYDEIRKTPAGTSSSTYRNLYLPGRKLFSESYHVYEILWSPTSIIWKLDGKRVHLAAIGAEVTRELRGPMYLILNNGIGSWFEKVGYPDETAVYPQDMLVDWVRVYGRTGD